jgi:glycosyltransferase involved in cell wall biosynthesis
MRITILQGAFLALPPHNGGAVEKRWYEMAKVFAAEGHTVTHISRRLPGLSEEEVIDGVTHLRVKGYDTPRSLKVLKWYDLLYTLRSLRQLPEADILITNTFWSPIFAPKRAGAIVVDVARIPKGQLCLYKKAKYFRANSSAVLNAIIEENAEFENRSILIPNPLPFKAEVDCPQLSKEKRILYAGRIHPEKGVHLIIEAFQTLIAQHPDLSDWQLDLVGPWEVADGGGGRDYRAHLMGLFDHQNIHWVDPIFDTEKLNEYYKHSSIFVYPSLAEKGETFGLAPLEAMAWGAVPVVSQIQCFQDFIVHGKNGVIFDHRSTDPAKSLSESILHIARIDRSDMMQEAIKVRVSHSIDKISNQFLDAFVHLLNEK